MKIFFSEYINNYATYTFSYAVYCIKEKNDNINEIYEKGFLPFTAKLSIQDDIFYLSRSIRIKLENFSDTSENRRVDRIINNLAEIDYKITPKYDFDIKNKSFLNFCLNFAEERFTGGNMESERLNYLLNRENLTHIITFYSKEKVYAYVFCSVSDEILHYWFAFYDTEYINYSLGKWIMWKTISIAKESGKKFIYLGTCYTTKGLYKVRDHKGAEFFDGLKWNNDMKILKKICKHDGFYEKTSDDFKIN